MWLQLSEKNRKHPSFGVSGRNLYLMGKPGLLGGCWVIPSQTSSWNRHSMLYGSLTILKWDRERIGVEKEEMHTSQMYLRYTVDTPTGRIKKFTGIAAATVMRRIKVRMKMTWFHLQTSLFSNNNTAIMI